MTTTQPAPPSLDDLRLLVTERLGADVGSLSDHDDLIREGVDSITIMGIAATLRRLGVEVTFADLAERPTLKAWHDLVAAAGDPLDGELAPERLVDRPLPELDEGAPFELGTLQLAYWIGRDAAQPLGVGAHFYAELDGASVAAERLERAVRRLITRHGMLRARFLDDGTQQISPACSWPGLAVHDLRTRGPAAGAELAALRARLSHRRLEVERGEVFDVQLSLLDGGRTRTHVDIEMLVADAQSFRILLGDLAALYESDCECLPALDYSFPRYLAEKSQRRGRSWQAARDYWRGRLAELPGAPQLPLAADPERLRAPHATRRFKWLSAAEGDALARRGRAHGVTPSVVFATAFAEVLAAWSATPRFLLNLPFYDRQPLHVDVTRLVGDFTNVVLLAVDASEHRSFAQAARALQAQLREDGRHAEYSGLDVLRDLGRARPGEAPTAPVVFTSALSLGELFEDRVRRCLGAPSYTMSQTPGVWLDCQVTEREGGLYLNWDAVEELFCEGVLDAMFGAFVGLLGWLAEPGSDWEAGLPGLVAERQLAVRAAHNGVAGPAPARGLHERFFDRARERGGRPAVLWGTDGCLTHAQLRERALGVAGLLRAHRVGAGEPVMVTLPKGPEQLVAVLGVLAAGGCYVPVGVEQPVARRARIATSAGVRLVLSEPGLELPDGLRALTLAQADAHPAPLEDPVAVDPDQLAYIIYTSGSTGEPKGVMLTHRAALNTIDAINERFGIDEQDRALSVSALDFDLSVYDIYGLLDRGGAVIVPNHAQRRDPVAWLELISNHRATILNCVPALLDMTLEAAGPGQALQSLRLVLLGGDWVGLDLPGRLRAAAPACRFVALGGTTETAIHSSVREVAEVPDTWRSIPYGYPLPGQRFRVVDARGRDCPDWVPGELWIGGDSVALGYRGDPERTARQFLERDGIRWYRTGDLGRYWPDGTLEFLGRTDHQIKIRGHRIELGEIEATLEAHPEISRAVVVAMGDVARRLCAFVTAPHGTVDIAALRRFVTDRLPPYMVPDELQTIAALPLTSNGKVDRRSIEELASTAATPADAPPQGPLEAEIADLFAELLGADRVSRTDSFFALGGDSLLATRAVESLRRRFGVELTLRRLFGAPTVSALAEVIEVERAAGGPVEEGVI